MQGMRKNTHLRKIPLFWPSTMSITTMTFCFVSVLGFGGGCGPFFWFGSVLFFEGRSHRASGMGIRGIRGDLLSL